MLSVAVKGVNTVRKFNVYRDEDGIYEAVKKGWCWPAFFFGSIWALFSGLWVAAFFIFPIDFLLTVAGNRSGDPYVSDPKLRWVISAG